MSSSGFCCSSESQNENERKRKDRQDLKSCQAMKRDGDLKSCQAMKRDGDLKSCQAMKHDGDTNCSWCIRDNSKRFGKKTRELEIRGRIETKQTTALLR